MALYLQRTNRTLSYLAAYDYLPENANLVQGSSAIPVKQLAVTPDFFRVFEMEPRLGRGFVRQDGVLHAPGVVVISDSLWHQTFSADPNILGKNIILGSRRYTVIGVAPAAFRTESKVDAWVPLSLIESPTDQAHNWNVVARLRPDVGYAQAADDLNRLHMQLRGSYPKTWDQYESLSAFDFHDSLVGDVRPALSMLMSAVILLLVIVVANILSLLLTRSIAIRPELSLRTALGASSWRILRQMIVENAILCTAGGLGGLLIASAAAQILLHLSPIELPEFSSVHIDAPALAFAAGLTVLSALLFSLVPAMETRRNQLNESLRLATARIATGRHLAQKALVVGEVAVSLVLLFAAAILLNSFWKLSHTQPGFETRNVLTFRNSFATEQYANTATLSQLLGELTTQLEAVPGVEASAAAISLPAQLTPEIPFQIVERPIEQQRNLISPKYMPITPRYFSVLGVPLIRGRTFTASDTHGSTPVVIVNQEIVRSAFNGVNPVGQHISVGAVMGPEFQDSAREIVGVVQDLKQNGLDQVAPPILYLPAAQIPDSMTRMETGLLGTSWLLRLRVSNADVASQAQRIFMRNAHAPLLSIRPLRDVVGASIAQQRFNMLLLCAFGLSSLIIGAAGLYGVMSYTLVQRTKEIGIRMALGAKRADIYRMVLQEAGLLVGLGLFAGVLGGLAGKQLLNSMLFEVHEGVPVTFALTCSVLILTGLVAAWFPARRAASIEPIQALRME